MSSVKPSLARKIPGIAVQSSIIMEDIDERKSAMFSKLKIIVIVSQCDIDSTRKEFRVNTLRSTRQQKLEEANRRTGASLSCQ